MMVLDASAALELLLRSKKGDGVARVLREHGDSVAAPHLIDVEVTQVLRQLLQSKSMDADRALVAINDFLALRVTRYPHMELMLRVWELRQNLNAYDGVYVALAESLDVPLVTCDGKIARASGHDAEIQLI